MFIPLHKNLNRKKTNTGGVLSCVLVLLLSACAAVPEKKVLAEPELILVSESPVSSSFTGTVLTYSYELYNPNDEPLYVETVKSFLILDGEIVSSISDDGIVLDAGARKSFPLVMDLSFDELYRDFPAFAAAEVHKADWQLRTDCRYRDADEQLQTLSAADRGEMDLVKLPRFDFESLYIKSLGLMGADIIILMKTENPNPFALNMDALKGTLRVNNLRWTELESAQSVELPAGSVSDFGFQFRLEFLSMGRTVRDLISREEALDYLFDGVMTLSSDPVSPDGEELPLRFSGDVEIIHPDTTGGAHSSVKIENSIESNLINIFGHYR